MTALELEGVHVDLGGREVLTNVSATFVRGELVALLGPNGAGKTTLLRVILGLVPRRAGRVVQEPFVRARGIGYVPQRHDFAWDYPASVEDVVMTGLTGSLGLFRRPRAEHWRSVRGALDRVRMTDLRSRPVGDLSGGQRQRVLVARALALGSPVLLLDEPLTGLDMPTQELLLPLFAELASEGRAVLMTTHDILGARLAADRLILLNRTIIADAPPGRLLDPELWQRTFQVGADSPLLTLLTVRA